VLLLWGLPAAMAQARANARLDTATVRIVTASDTVLVRVEIAVRPLQQMVGLQNRDSLAVDGGMLFRFPELMAANIGHLTMYSMHFPIDVAFIDSTGVIVEILTLQPCKTANRTECPKYASPKAFTEALEVNAGFFARNGIKPGDRLHQR
jgi:uncharacterized protein